MVGLGIYPLNEEVFVPLYLVHVTEKIPATHVNDGEGSGGKLEASEEHPVRNSLK